MKKLSVYFSCFLFLHGNIFSQEIHRADSLKNQERKSSFSLGAGMGYLIAPVDTSVPEVLEPLYQQLKTGFCLNGIYRFQANKYIEIGAKYALFRSHGNLSYSGSTASAHWEISETITTHYFAPSISSVLHQSEINSFISISIPLILYDDYSNIVFIDTKSNIYAVNQITLKGQTAGLNIDLGTEYNIDAKKYFGINVSFLGAVLKQMEVQDPISNKIIEQPNNISRVDVTLYFRFR